MTQPKWNLRHAKSAKTQTPARENYEEEINFVLQTPIVPQPQSCPSDQKLATEAVKEQGTKVKEAAPGRPKGRKTGDCSICGFPARTKKRLESHVKKHETF